MVYTLWDSFKGGEGEPRKIVNHKFTTAVDQGCNRTSSVFKRIFDLRTEVESQKEV